MPAALNSTTVGGYFTVIVTAYNPATPAVVVDLLLMALRERRFAKVSRSCAFNV